MKRLTVWIVLLLLVLAIPGVSGVYHDGSFTGDPPPESDGSDNDSDGSDGNPDGSDGNSDGSDNDSDGSDGNPDGDPTATVVMAMASDSEEPEENPGPTDEEIAEAVDEETQQILDQLDEAANRVAAADLDVRRLMAADVYARRTDPSRALGSSMNAYMEAGRNGYSQMASADAHAWNRQHAGAARVRSNLQQELGISRSPSLGDPVRIVDGAYLTTIPLPVFSTYGVEIDLSLRYDSRRTAQGMWGVGWTNLLEERIITGTLKPPAIEALHAEELSATLNRLSHVQALIGEVLSGDRPVGEAHAAVRANLHHYRNELDPCNSRIDRLNTLLPIAAISGASVSQVQQALSAAQSLRARILEAIAVLSSTNEFLNNWHATRDGLNEIVDDIETLKRKLAEARERYNRAVARNRSVTYPGARIPMTDTGFGTAVYVDQHGGTHVFTATADPDLYRAASLPHHRLQRNENGWSLRAPTGHFRGFNRSGELDAIGMRDTTAVIIRREVSHTKRTLSITRPDGHEFARFEQADDGRSVTFHPATGAPTSFTLRETGISHVASPRGDISYQYDDSGMTAIVREDGRRTSITYEGAPSSGRVTSVTYPSGAREFFEYPSPELRIYRDPDGLETKTTVDGFSVIKREFPSGHIVENTFDDGYRLTLQTDNRGHSERRRYDKRGALIQRQFADGSWIRIERNDAGAPISVSSDRGTVWEARRSAVGTPQAITYEGVTWRINRPTGETDTRQVTTDRGGRWEISYSLYGTPREIVRGDGRREAFDYDELGRLTARFIDGEAVEKVSYNSAGQAIQVMRAGTTYEYRYERDPAVTIRSVNGQFLSRTIHDADSRPIRHEYHDNTTEQFVFSAAGRLVEYTARSGMTLRYERDTRGRLVSIVDPDAELRWTFQYDATGRRVAQTLPDGSRYEHRFDANGQRIATQLPDGSLTIEQHLPGGRVRRVDAFGNASTHRHDATGRPTHVLHGDGSDLHIEYIGDETRYIRNGELLTTETHDAYGRVTVRRYSDGTAERYRYGHSAFPTELTDRRGGVEEWHWDEFGRCVYHKSPNGAEEYWQYEPQSTIHRRPDGDETRVHFDPEGRPVAITANGEKRSLSYGPDGVLEVNTSDGSVERRFFDPLSQVFGPTAMTPFAPYSNSPVQRTADGAVQTEWNGSSREVIPHWTGLTAQLREAVGTPNEALWTSTLDPYGQITSRLTPDATAFELRWDADRRILYRRTPAGDSRTYRYDRFGNLAGWRNSASNVAITIDAQRREMTARDDGGTGISHAVRFGPYGRLLRDEQVVPAVSDPHTAGFSASETEPANSEALSEQLITTVARDTAGRTVRIESSTVSKALDISYSGEGTEVALTVGGYTITTTPKHGASSTENNALSVTVSTPSGTIWPISHTITETVHDGRITVDEHVAGVITFSHRRRSGFQELIDAVIYIRDDAGRIIAEQGLNGTIYSFRYNQTGRLSAVATNQNTPSGTAAADVSRAPATTAPPAALASQWRTVPGLRGAPAAPLRLNEYRLDRSPSGRLVTRSDTTTDNSGRRTSIDETVIGYHPLSERPRTVHNGDSSWTIDRRIDGAPVRYIDHTSGATYGCTEHRFTLAGYAVTVRYWELELVSSEQDPPDTDQPSGRYRPVAIQDDVPAEFHRALEIRIDDKPFLFVDGDEIVVPFSDIRGTIRGVYRPDTVPPQPRFTAFPEALLYLATGSKPQEDIPPAGGLPIAIPYDTVITTLEHLPGIDLLFAPERAVSPQTGTFTTVDPSLDGMDWYQFAAGDPINFQDTTGHYVVSVKHGHEQQDDRWNEDYLGSSTDTTIHDAGCTLVTVSNAINQIADDVVTDPGRLNQALTDKYYVDDDLLANRDVETILTEATGNAVAHVPIRPEEVDIDRVIDAIADDPNTSYVVSARIQTYTDTKDNGRQYYPHSVSVTGFNNDNVPIFRDTSNRRRTTLGPDETVLRYDVYATSKCPVH